MSGLQAGPATAPELAGKVVLVTGGGKGIGAAVTRGFGASGAHVVLHYNRSGDAAREVARSIADAGGHADVIQSDLTSPGAAAELVDRVVTRFGALDVLVNNAGAMVGRRPFEQIDDAFIDAVFDLNVRAVVHASRAALPALRASRGCIINVSSISARTGGSPGSSIYSASKAFISTLTRAMARELAPGGIRVNAVSPGTVATDFHREYSSPEKLEATRKGIPLQRLGSAEDCVGTFLYLASGLRSGYVTGQVVEINGGQLMA